MKEREWSQALRGMTSMGVAMTALSKAADAAIPQLAVIAQAGNVTGPQRATLEHLIRSFDEAMGRANG